MDFLDVGGVCQAPGCRARDFLPVQCALCAHHFCVAHQPTTAHGCTGSAAAGGGGDGGDASTIDRRLLGGARTHCLAPGCREMVGVHGIACARCGGRTCVAHRFPEAHACSAAGGGDGEPSESAHLARPIGVPGLAAARLGGGVSGSDSSAPPATAAGAGAGGDGASRARSAAAVALERKVRMSRLKMKAPLPRGVPLEAAVWLECVADASCGALGGSGSRHPLCVDGRFTTVAQVVDAAAAACGCRNRNADVPPESPLRLWLQREDAVATQAMPMDAKIAAAVAGGLVASGDVVVLVRRAGIASSSGARWE